MINSSRISFKVPLSYQRIAGGLRFRCTLRNSVHLFAVVRNCLRGKLYYENFCVPTYFLEECISIFDGMRVDGVETY